MSWRRMSTQTSWPSAGAMLVGAGLQTIHASALHTVKCSALQESHSGHLQQDCVAPTYKYTQGKHTQLALHAPASPFNSSAFQVLQASLGAAAAQATSSRTMMAPAMWTARKRRTGSQARSALHLQPLPLPGQRNARAARGAAKARWQAFCCARQQDATSRSARRGLSTARAQMIDIQLVSR